MHLLIFDIFNFFLSDYSINMADIKLEDLYFSKEELKDIIQLVAKKRNIKNYKNKSDNKLYKIFKKQSKYKKRIDEINLKNKIKRLNRIKRSYLQYF